jgi:hypothetical protein
MQTVKYIERLWSARRYETLLGELVACRADAQFLPLLQTDAPSTPGTTPVATSGSTPAAAMAMIRLDELAQSGAPVYHKFLVCLLATQESDGGWGDPIISALCLRALLGSRGGGEAIDRGLLYLANLQKDDGIWPRIPFRRMPADALTSAVVMYHLSHEPRFREAVAFDDAVRWFDLNSGQLDPETRKLWFRVRLRCGISHERSSILWTSAI